MGSLTGSYEGNRCLFRRNLLAKDKVFQVSMAYHRVSQFSVRITCDTIYLWWTQWLFTIFVSQSDYLDQTARPRTKYLVFFWTLLFLWNTNQTKLALAWFVYFKPLKIWIMGQVSKRTLLCIWQITCYKSLHLWNSGL